MRYTIVRDHRLPPPRKFAWAFVGLCFVLAGSAALAWQSGGSAPKLRSAQVQEVKSNAPVAEAPQSNVNAVTQPGPQPVLPPAKPSASRQRNANVNRSTTTNSKKKSLPPQSSRGSSFLGIPLPSFGRHAPTQEVDSPAPVRTTVPVTNRASAAARGSQSEPKPATRVIKDAAGTPPAGASIARPSGSADAETKTSRRVTAATGTPQKLTPLKIAEHEDVRPAGFQNVTPGETKLSGIAQALGSPQATEREGDTTVMTYRVGPFPKIEVILAGDVVDSVIIHLQEPVAEKAVLAELGLSAFQPVEILDDDGNVLGRAVPERGVAVSYHGDARDRKVGEVVLGTITAESFLLRATDPSNHDYEKMLADAAFAASVDPNSAEAFGVVARILVDLGRYKEARPAIEKAIQLDANSGELRLLYARMLTHNDDYAGALKATEAVAKTANAPQQTIAQAELLWGDLFAYGPERNYAEAIEHHSKAIKIATVLAQHEHPGVRRAGRQTLVDANLAVARDVALGNYKRKSEVVPKWIAKADAAKEQALQDGEDAHLELSVAVQTVAAYACLTEPLDPTDAIETAIEKAQDLISASNDPLYKQQVEWMLGNALLDAVNIEHTRGNFDAATQYANNSLALLRDNLAHRDATPQRDYVMGRMYFALGALYAVGKNDHAEAVHYYLQAIPLLEKPLPDDLADESGRHGERFVSMGVSFWQNGNKSQAVELTEKGAEVLQQAVDAALVEPTSLAVPYSNLAAMYKQLGNGAEAKRYGDLAENLEKAKPIRR